MSITALLILGTIGLLLGIVVVLVESIRRRDHAAVVNAAVSLGIALVPTGLDVGSRLFFELPVPIDWRLPLWLALAGFLHSVGMLGPYDTVRWWDSLTHTISAALVAALMYAGLLVVGSHTRMLPSNPELISVLTVLFTIGAGVFWELIELVSRKAGERFDIEPVLVHYGWRDTAEDLVFDVVGALLVVFFDVRMFLPTAERFPRATTVFVIVSGLVIVVGSAVLLLPIFILGRDEQDSW